jgi:putative transposase
MALTTGLTKGEHIRTGVEKGDKAVKRAGSKRHSKKEIVEKLARAEEMTREGKTQNEIASVLGISVMTFHRWRKEFGSPARPATRSPSIAPDDARIREIEAENARLRNFVVRMLLENEALKERA